MKSMIATIKMMMIEKTINMIALLAPSHPSAKKPAIAEIKAVTPATTQIKDFISCQTDSRKLAGTGLGIEFLPNTLILRFKSLSSPMMPLFAYEAKSVMVYCTRSCKFYGLFLPG